MSAKSFFDEFPVITEGGSRPWLVLGKGPTFSRYSVSPTGGPFVLALNHAGAEVACDVAHAIDVDVIELCGEALLRKARYLVMPWVPHIRHERTLLTPWRMMDASGITLDEWCDRIPALRSFVREGRLLWYNLATCPDRLIRPGSPIVNVSYFSASAAIDLLAKVGVRQIRTLGVDGGTSYAQQFGGLSGITLLANGRSNFDLQFAGMTRTIMDHGVDLGPADMELPVRVFVGAEPEQWLAVKVLEYSIIKHSSVSVVVEPLYQALQDTGIVVPVPAAPELAPRTPFSYQRFAIPALKNYKGRAIYLDSDMLVFEDIRKMWAIEFSGAPLLSVEEPAGSGRRPQYSVAMLDCDALNWNVESLVRDLEAGKWTYEELMYEMKAAPGARAGIPARWNELERYAEGETALTHFTDMDQQPWLEVVNPIANVWCKVLLEAVKAGFISRADVEREVASGNIRPSLLAQVDLGVADPALLPRSARALDSHYLPPHVRARGLADRAVHPSPSSIWWLRQRRRARMAFWRTADRVGLWGALKKLRNLVKVRRQEMRIADARRRRGL